MLHTATVQCMLVCRSVYCGEGIRRLPLLRTTNACSLQQRTTSHCAAAHAHANSICTASLCCVLVLALAHPWRYTCACSYIMHYVTPHAAVYHPCARGVRIVIISLRSLYRHAYTRTVDTYVPYVVPALLFLLHNISCHVTPQDVMQQE